MNGGTYAEALKVGFDEKQAGMLSRLSAETRGEAVEEIEKRKKARAIERKNYYTGMFITGVAMVAMLLIGIALGRAFA